MAAFLLVAHAPLASALQAVAKHAFPDCGANLAALDVTPDMSAEQVEEATCTALETLGTGEILVLVDVFGATPCNAALKAADGCRVRVVTGVNVPMLWRSLCYADEPLQELVARAVDGAKRGVLQVVQPRRQNQLSPPLSHDQDPNQHQQ